jgi:RNA polymerase primary sigma factor
VHVREGQLRKIRKAQSHYIETTGNDPSPRQLALLLKMDEKNIQALLLASNTPASLDEARYGLNEDQTLGDFLEDDEATAVEDTAISASVAEQIKKAMDDAALTVKEKLVLRLRYGADMTLEEVAAELKVSRERVRQIQTRAEEKLRPHLVRAKILERPEATAATAGQGRRGQA